MPVSLYLSHAVSILYPCVFNKGTFMFSVYNFITMDDEQIEKFIKLYGEGDGDFSLAMVLPEYAENDARENENG